MGTNKVLGERLDVLIFEQQRLGQRTKRALQVLMRLTARMESMPYLSSPARGSMLFAGSFNTVENCLSNT